MDAIILAVAHSSFNNLTVTDLDNMYGEETADAIRIQYGGSVKVANIEALMLQPHIDGALIGGASLVAEDFIHFAKVAASIKY